jgi:hypothetical protein
VSIRIMTRVWDARGIPSSGVRLVLLKLADCANDLGERAFPSVSTIASDCELSRATVQRSIHWLRSEGWITEVSPAVHHRPSEWKILIDPDGRRIVPGLVDEGSHSETPPVEVEGPHPVEGGASSTTSRGRKHAIALYVPGTVKDPSGTVPPGTDLSVQVEPVGKPHPIKALLTEHERLFRQFIGRTPHYTGKDAKLAGQLIAQHGFETVVEMLPRLFTSLDPFIRQSGHDIAILSSCWNKLIVQSQPQAVMSETTSKTIAAGERWLARQTGKEAIDVPHK